MAASGSREAKSNDGKLSTSPKSQYLADRVEQPIFHRRHLKADEVKQAEKEVKINNEFNLLVRFKEQMELDKNYDSTYSGNMMKEASGPGNWQLPKNYAQDCVGAKSLFDSKGNFQEWVLESGVDILVEQSNSMKSIIHVLTELVALRIHDKEGKLAHWVVELFGGEQAFLEYINKENDPEKAVLSLRTALSYAILKRHLLVEMKSSESPLRSTIDFVGKLMEHQIDVNNQFFIEVQAFKFNFSQSIRLKQWFKRFFDEVEEFQKRLFENPCADVTRHLLFLRAMNAIASIPNDYEHQHLRNKLFSRLHSFTLLDDIDYSKLEQEVRVVKKLVSFRQNKTLFDALVNLYELNDEAGVDLLDSMLDVLTHALARKVPMMSDDPYDSYHDQHESVWVMVGTVFKNVMLSENEVASRLAKPFILIYELATERYSSEFDRNKKLLELISHLQLEAFLKEDKARKVLVKVLHEQIINPMLGSVGYIVPEKAEVEFSDRQILKEIEQLAFIHGAYWSKNNIAIAAHRSSVIFSPTLVTLIQVDAEKLTKEILNPRVSPFYKEKASQALQATAAALQEPTIENIKNMEKAADELHSARGYFDRFACLMVIAAGVLAIGLGVLLAPQTGGLSKLIGDWVGYSLMALGGATQIGFQFFRERPEDRMNKVAKALTPLAFDSDNQAVREPIGLLYHPA